MLAAAKAQAKSQSDQRQYKQSNSKLAFRLKFRQSLTGTIDNLSLVSFALNYGYAIENVWLTMLMIINNTPNIVDSFVWIVPVVLAIFVRPYVIRSVHSVSFKICREIQLVSCLLCLGGFGCVIVGLSSSHTERNMIKRIAQCTIGWTIMDVSFELALYFADKICEGYENMKEGLQNHEDLSTVKAGIFGQDTYSLRGLLTGYLVGIAICLVMNGKTVKTFYECGRYAYFSAAFIAILAAIQLYIHSKLNVPQTAVESPQSGQASLTISIDPAYYLPGLYELLNSNVKTASFLSLHFIITFFNDVIVIYTTMWLTEPTDLVFAKQGQYYTSGLKVGSLYLIIFTILDNLQFKFSFMKSPHLLMLFLFLLIFSSYYCFHTYTSQTFLYFILNVVIVNHLYRRAVLDEEGQHNAVFKRCKEIAERAQKIFILCLMPGCILLILNRDDIPDCLTWSSILAVLALLAYGNALKVRQLQVKTGKVDKNVKEVQKIQ